MNQRLRPSAFQSIGASAGRGVEFASSLSQRAELAAACGQRNGGCEGNHVPITTLIVDDSPFARTVIRHHLTKFGCRVAGEAENAAQAIRMFHELRPDLVTLDVMMPEVDGFDSLRAFRQMRSEKPGLAIIVVSAVPFDKTRDTFIGEGALAYVVKPFTQFSFEPVRRKLVQVFRQSAGELGGAR
jgi:two-component system chemotaxis response regulator CheY